ncbi:MAG: DUF234 domain-containing protein [Thermoplasmata archaeon]|nr:DUF234 domain-containing protein [Thermoplasmata archaeon]
MDPSASAVENARRLALSSPSFLFEEPKHLLLREFREPAGYNSCLKSIARGNRKLGHICSDLRCRTSDVTPYLSALCDAGLVERRVPVTEGEHSRRGRYVIADPFTALWFRFASPHRADIELHETGRAEEDLRAHFIDSHVSFVFEDISRGELRRHLKAAGVAARYGSYWDGGTEIGVVALDSEHGTAYVGECKYRESPVGEDVLDSLVRKASAVEAFDGMRIVPCLFSVSGYTEGAVREAERTGVVLFDRGEPVTTIPTSVRGQPRPSAELRFPSIRQRISEPYWHSLTRSR